MRRFAAVFVCAVHLHGCAPLNRDEHDTESAPHRLGLDGSVRLRDREIRALGLRVAPAATTDFDLVEERMGRVVARPGDEALLASAIEGRVVYVPTTPIGSRVANGERVIGLAPVLTAGEQVSLTLQSSDLRGQLAAAEQELTLRRAAAERARTLASAVIVSQQTREEAETLEATTTAHIEALHRQLAGRPSQPRGVVWVTAPIEGSLASIDVVVGAVVAPGTSLGRIVHLGPRFVDVIVPPFAAVGSRYEIVGDRSSVAAMLVARGASVGPSGMRVDRVAELADSGLLPGLSVAVRVVHASAASVTIPTTAVVGTDAGDVVYVERTRHEFVERGVQVSNEEAGRVRVESGLVAGERVVVVGALGLRGERLRAALGAAE